MPYDPYSLWSNWPYAGKTLNGYLSYLTSLQNRIEGSQESAGLDALEYQNISRLECLNRYVKWFETGASNVLIVSSSDALDPRATVLDSNSSLLAFNWIANSWDSLQAGYDQWPCNRSNNFTCAYFSWDVDEEEASTWNVFGYNVDYCLAKQLDLTDKCHVEINKNIMIGKSQDTIPITFSDADSTKRSASPIFASAWPSAIPCGSIVTGILSRLLL